MIQTFGKGEFMAKSGSFGIGTIIFLVIAYNAIFDDDDDEKKVEIIEQVEEVLVETKEVIDERIKPEVQEIVTSAKKKLDEVLKKDEEKEEVAEEEPDKPPPEIIHPEPDETFEKL